MFREAEEILSFCCDMQLPKLVLHSRCNSVFVRIVKRDLVVLGFLVCVLCFCFWLAKVNNFFATDFTFCRQLPANLNNCFQVLKPFVSLSSLNSRYEVVKHICCQWEWKQLAFSATKGGFMAISDLDSNKRQAAATVLPRWAPSE